MKSQFKILSGAWQVDKFAWFLELTHFVRQYLACLNLFRRIAITSVLFLTPVVLIVV